jgi:hypothetical protein
MPFRPMSWSRGVWPHGAGRRRRPFSGEPAAWGGGETATWEDTVGGEPDRGSGKERGSLMWMLYGSGCWPAWLIGEGPEKRSLDPAKGWGRSPLLARCARGRRWDRRMTRAGYLCRGSLQWLDNGEQSGGQSGAEAVQCGGSKRERLD